MQIQAGGTSHPQSTTPECFSWRGIYGHSCREGLKLCRSALLTQCHVFIGTSTEKRCSVLKTHQTTATQIWGANFPDNRFSCHSFPPMRQPPDETNAMPFQSPSGDCFISQAVEPIFSLVQVRSGLSKHESLSAATGQRPASICPAFTAPLCSVEVGRSWRARETA